MPPMIYVAIGRPQHLHPTRRERRKEVDKLTYRQSGVREARPAS